jgi:hypothetical protein
MDYGPYLTASLEVSPGNIANKGVAIRLDPGPGGVAAGREFILFDTDTLRCAAAWIGPGFINWENIVFDGQHGVHADIVGQRLLANPDAPGWADPQGSFQDRRLIGRDSNRYGPLPREWARWKGLYVHGDQVVLAYRVGDVDILEMPASEGGPDQRLITRTLNLGPRESDLIVQVAHAPGCQFETYSWPGDSAIPAALLKCRPPAAGPSTEAVGTPDSPALSLDGKQHVEITDASGLDMAEADFTICARLRSPGDGTIFARAPGEGPWAPDGKTFFIRDGLLHYDIGWMGVVAAEEGAVDDGRWHDVAVTWQHRSADVRLYVDGALVGQGQLRPGDPDEERPARIGFTSPDFPAASNFVGELAEVRFYQRALDPPRLVASQWPRRADLRGWWRGADTEQKVADFSGRGHVGRLVQSPASPAAQAAAADPLSTFAAVTGAAAGTEWMASDGHLRLRIPPGPAAAIKLLLAPVANDGQLPALAEFVASLPGPRDLATLTQGGPRRWQETVTSRVTPLGSQDGAYAVEDLGAPVENPYRSWMRLGGLDFFTSEPRRAAVCTWQGDVWTVDGLGGDLDELTWTRVASGMFQPLGLKIVDDEIFVCCRDQITVLRDLNGDGEADFYENFNNDHQVTEHFHEFAMDLQTDPQGNFYYAKSARHALDALVPHHGTLIQVSPDGSRSRVVAHGFRAANGVCVNADGTFIISDQEGHWTPKNRINWITPGGFYGNMMGWHEGRQVADFLPPVIWIHNNFDRSPAEQLWVDSGQWGPLQGALLNLSYGTGQIHVVLMEQVDGVRQGGLVRLPIPDFPTGVMRGRFHPVDGQLYCCGLFGWSGDKTAPGGFYRVRHTGRPLYLPIGLHVTRQGVRITFSEPLDEESAQYYGNYAVNRWNYRRTASYGSADYSVKERRRKGRDRVRVEQAVLSEDGKSVLLEIRDMRPCMQMEIRYRVQAADGTPLAQTIHHTIHRVGSSQP